MRSIIEEKILPEVSKPARYIGNELNSTHKDRSGKVCVAISYPDSYEIGMSNLGISILYHILNKRQDVFCERVFAPWPDMEARLLEQNIPLFSLESWTPIKDFDIIGFSVQNELTYTNILNMLKLAGIPLRRSERNEQHPLVIAGGASTNNPRPLSEFIDAFVLGDGEEVILEIVDTYKMCRGAAPAGEQDSRIALLERLSKLEGVYVPGMNEVKDVNRRIVKDLNTIDYPTSPIVPFIEVVHDRATIEIMRGCPRQCKFCQAGTVNKPVRLLKPEKIIRLAKETIDNTGFEEVSLVSLSSSDYPGLLDIAKELAAYFEKKKVSLSLPSLRADTFDENMSKQLHHVRKSGITIAPEAGTQRLRDHICKGLTEENILNSTVSAFSGGANNLKLYFMIGLPTETDDDINGIVDLAYKIIKEGKKANPRAKITVNVATFIPKKNTPFEDEPMIGLEEIKRKQAILKQGLRHKSIELRWHEPQMSLIEGMFSTGGEELAPVLEKALELGCKFDNWVEYFDHSKWKEAIGKGAPPRRDASPDHATHTH